MRRQPVSALFACILFLFSGSSGWAQAPAVETGGPSARCALRVYYADKRPYESANSDPFYAVAVVGDWGVPGHLQRPRRWFHPPSHLVILTDGGMFEKILGHPGGSEFTLPTHGRVVAAWIDAVADATGTLQRCDPSGAFFVDGYHEIAFTKFYRLLEKAGRIEVADKTHLPLIPVLPLMPLATLRDPGRRPAGAAVAAPAPCADSDRDAGAASPIVLRSDDNADATVAPSAVVDVSPLGRAMAVDVVTSSGSRKIDDAMLAAALDAKFTPARRQCTNVPDRLVVPVSFSP
jgi:TonB family protein